MTDQPDFTPEDDERARRYHRPLYVAFALDLVLGLGVASALAFSPLGDWVFAPLNDLAWWAQATAYPALILGVSAFVRAPLAFWRSYVHEHRWGFSTQTVGGWLSDRAKGVAIGAALTGGVMFVFVAVARAFPRAWPWVAAPALAALVLALSFLAPVVFEPIFNRFRPLPDPPLVEGIRALAERAGVPVRDVLVSDASRRTRKENAYVSGLGTTRRVVVFDTLLRRADPRQVRLVVAHELGHRRARHVAKGTVLGMAGAVAGVLLLWAVLGIDAVLRATGAEGPGDPRIVPFVLLFGAVVELIASPFGSALSRRWESAADRFSLGLTGDLDLFVQSHRDLARSNLSDLDPPRLLYLWTFGHPTPSERIAAARRWAARAS